MNQNQQILKSIRKMMIKKIKTIKKIRVYVIKFIISENAHTSSRRIENRAEKKISKFATKRDRKFEIISDFISL
jgi:predicted ATP-dependent Lon-type protease